jgi:amino acid adenylation domain-containing protein/FkbM family methyltransferase
MQSDTIQGFQLSPQQKRLWSLTRHDEHQLYHAQCLVLIEGRLEAARLRAAIAQMVQRHEILRTSFTSLQGMTIPLQVIHDSAHFKFIQYEKQDIEKLWQETQQAPFDVQENGQLQISLIALAEDKHLLLISLPAIYADADGLHNLVAEISRCYDAVIQGEAPDDEPMQYADISEWQNELLHAENREPGRMYWRKQDISSLTTLRLPYERKAPEATDVTPQSISHDLNSVQLQKIEALANKYETSTSVLLLTCWHILLARLTARTSIVIGTALNGRKYEEMKTALGLLTRYVPIECHSEPESRFADLLQQQNEVMQKANTWQENFNWDDLIDDPESFIEAPFFPFCFDYTEQPAGYDAGEVSFTICKEYVCTERFHVRLCCVRNSAGLTAEFHYDSNLYAAADIERLSAEFQTLIDSVLEYENALISELEIVGEAERKQLLEEWNSTTTPYPSAKCIQELFERQAAQTPNAVALVYEGKKLSYEELNRRANQVAHYLKSRGVGPEMPVGICIERSLEMIVGVLGILKAGGAYVPLEPTYPQERLAMVLAETDAPVLVTQQHLVAGLPPHQAEVVCLDTQWEEIAKGNGENPVRLAQAENLAYVIYTSGSSGRPKGVCVTHRNLVHSTVARSVFYRQPPSCFLLLSSFAFDSSIAGIFWTLCSGGTLVLPAEGLQRDPQALARLVQEQSVSHLLSLPSLHALMLEVAKKSELSTLKVVIVAGEACAAELVERHLEVMPRTRLYNEYGPTEATVWSSVYECLGSAKHETVSIGRPIANARIYILDEEMRVVPIGVAGEIYIGGAGVARGYYQRPDETAARYLPDPFSDEGEARLYRTGDRARYRSNGEIEFLGRVDNQVKIRGYRIELGEIEAVLREHAAVRESVVVATDDRIGGKRLVGYLILDEQHAFTACQLLRYKREGLLARLGSSELPNGMTIIHHNKNEAGYLYQEIFEEQAYFAHGIQLEPGACVFDVGANIGLFSLFVGQICEDARIYAFEPIPQIFRVLRANSQLYGLNARLFECGLSNEARSESFTYYPHLSLMSGLFADDRVAQSLIKSFEVNKQRMGEGMALPSDEALDELLRDRLESEAVECRLRTISDVINEEGVKQIDLLKIDAENSELHVLQGIAKSDWTKIRQLVIEVEDREQRLEQITGLLRREGFEVALEQDQVLADTRLYKVYAVRPSQKTAAVRELNKKFSLTRKPAWNSPAVVIREVRDFLKQKLPEHMVPSAFVLLEELLLMPNGKIDRQSLPAPEIVSEGELRLPRTPVEEVLAGIWSEVLGVRELSVTANFFELGGHSLLATQVMSRVREALQVQLPVRSLFAQPTVRGLAAEIEAQLQAAEGVMLPPIKRGLREGELPLSYAQQRLWFADQLMPGSALYNVAAAMRLSGPLNISALERTLREIIERHEVLRTSFPARQGEPVQVIAEQVEFELLVTDLSELGEAEREREARRLAEEEAQTPFDLAAGPLVRARLLRLGEAEHVALFTMHHIVSDGWSVGVLIKEVSQLYEAYSRGEESPLAELPIQYADYAVWQREWLTGEVLAKQLEYWREQLAGAPETLALPTDKPRPAVQSFCGGQQHFELSSELSEQLKELSRQESSSLFMTLLAAFQALLHYYSNQTDIVVGVDIANRHRVEVERLIGFFINILLMRTNLSGNPTFRELLTMVRETTLAAYAHQDLPFERLVEELQPERSLSGMPLVQTMFSFHNAPQAELKLSDLTLRPFESDGNTAKRDLTLFMTDTDQGLRGTWNYNSNLFNASTIQHLSAQFELLLTKAVGEPDVRLSGILEILTEARRNQTAMEKKERRDSRLSQFMSIAPHAVNLAQVKLTKTEYLNSQQKMPLVIRPALDDVDLMEWARNHRQSIETQLLEHGAILFRGFNTDSASEFERFALHICPELFGEYGDLPRAGVSGKVYGSTPYPSEQPILFHNESSHLQRWPMKIWFFCMQAAQQGGETPIVDCRKVYEALDPKIRERFTNKKLMYVRNYVEGLDVSWQQFFRTTEKSVVEDYCRKASIAFEWKNGAVLRTRQVCNAVLQHPKTGQAVFFNQLQLHHVSCLQPETRASLLSLLKEEDLPRNVYYGDGTPIEDSVIDEIRGIYQQLAINFRWQERDILMLDNMLTAHGRNPYVGERKIVVAMGEMITNQNVSFNGNGKTNAAAND